MVFDIVIFCIEGLRMEREGRKSGSGTSAMLQSSVTIIRAACGGSGRVQSFKSISSRERSLNLGVAK